MPYNSFVQSVKKLKLLRFTLGGLSEVLHAMGRSRLKDEPIPSETVLPESEEYPATPDANRGILFSNVRILLVEDNIVNQTAAARMLEKCGCEVFPVSNGQEAVSVVQKGRRFNLILMDCEMPLMDGYKATSVIRKLQVLQRQPRTPIIAFTAHALKGDDTKCLRAGMDDYITKPVRKQDLEDLLLAWLPSEKRVEGVYAPDSMTSLLPKDATLDERLFRRFNDTVGSEIVPLLVSHREMARSHLEMIKNGLDSGNFEDICVAAHTIKSANANLGAMKTVYLARQIETLAHGDVPDIEQLKILATELEYESMRAYAAMACALAEAS